MNNPISPEVRALIDAHLDAVERQLDGNGVPREKRRGIVDDLETHILEMLDSAGNRDLTSAEVSEMLGRLDPPEAYGKESVQRVQGAPPTVMKDAGEPQLCRQARQGVGWIAAALLAQVVLLLGSFAHVEVTPPGGAVASGPSPAMMMFLMVLLIAAAVAPIIATSLGWIAVEKIKNSNGNLHGRGLATFEALFYPLIVAWMGAFVLWYLIIVAYYDGTEVPNRGRAVWLIGSACTAIVLSIILGLLLRRLTRSNASAFQKIGVTEGDLRDARLDSRN